MRYLIGFGLLLALGVVGCGGESDSEACASFCARDVECFPPEEQVPECEKWCSDEIELGADDGPACRAAVVNVVSCVTNLQTCEQVYDWWSSWWSDPPSYPCKDADDAVTLACMDF